MSTTPIVWLTSWRVTDMGGSSKLKTLISLFSNTCHIREKAAEKVYSELGRLRQLREQKRDVGDDLMIGVAGCVAQAEGQAMLDRAPFVDLVVGPQTYHRLPEMLHRRARSEGAVLDTDFPIESKFDLLPTDIEAEQPVSAFLTVQGGPVTSFAHFAWCPIRAALKRRGLFRILSPKPNAWCGLASRKSPF